MQSNEMIVFQSQKVSSCFDEKKIELLKSTICKGSTDDEFELFLHACKRTGLDPFMKQIYAVKRWDSDSKTYKMTIQTGIDGYRLIAERTGKYSPGREPTYQYNENGQIISSTSYVKKQTADGTWHEIAATAFFSEYCQKTKDGKPTRFWLQMAHTMLAKCAEALALRKAFPGDLSGLYTKEEMQQAEIEPKENRDQIEVPVENISSEKRKLMSVEEAREIYDILNSCSPEFIKSFWEGFSNCTPPVTTLTQLKASSFSKIKAHVLKNRDEYLASKDMENIA